MDWSQVDINNIVSMVVSLVEDNILADYEVDCILNDLE